ncbi:unnamed protein product [Caenorhabditis bovis]|uniref:G-protein coupled receptors family 1 profile domain-containing protein n=1 Tax=Caenorhabditis bovis TaxID=2654633 RepID=A0A8S1EQL9_9PELO|nr:unnamed protein product [Caenorhabditis bovis]
MLLEDDYEATSAISNGTDEEICGYFEGYSTQRFIIITLCSVCSLFGFLANILLMAVFRRTLPSSIFLAALALCDALICLTYLLLFGVDAGIVYLKNRALFFLYHQYIVPVFFTAKVVQFAIPFILMLITFERYLWTCTESKRQIFSALFNESGRNVTVIFLFAVSLALRVPVLFATKVQSFPLCEDYFRSESVVPTEWAINSEAYHVFDFHVITAIQMFFPFFVLLILNLTIIKRLIAEKRENMYPVFRGTSAGEMKKVAFVQGNMPENYVLLQVAADVIKGSLIHSDTEADPAGVVETIDEQTKHRASIFHSFVLAFKQSSRTKRSQLRNAIYTMLAIVTSYLVCNSVHLFLTILERFDPSYLYESDDRSQSSTFYIVLSDTVSICYMVSSAIRICIYAKCNPKLRKEIADYIHRRSDESQPNSA